MLKKIMLPWKSWEPVQAQKEGFNTGYPSLEMPKSTFWSFFSFSFASFYWTFPIGVDFNQIDEMHEYITVNVHPILLLKKTVFLLWWGWCDYILIWLLFVGLIM